MSSKGGGCVPQRRQLRSINQRGCAPTTALSHHNKYDDITKTRGRQPSDLTGEASKRSERRVNMDGGFLTTTTTPLYTSAVNIYLRTSLTAARPLVFVMSWRCCGWGGLAPRWFIERSSAVGGRNPQSVAPPWGGGTPLFSIYYI